MAKLSKKNFDKRISEDSKFHEPNAIKYEREREKPKDAKNSPWDFRAPCYDQRSGPWVNVGTNQGVGHKQPVGHEGNPKARVPCLPMGRPDTMDSDEIA